MTNTALQEALAQLSALKEAAQKGAIIPVRLPGQIEEIEKLLQSAEDAQAKADQQAPPPADVAGAIAGVMADNTEFMKVAVHELRTPLTSIRGYADMMANPGMPDKLTEMQSQLMQVIRSNAKRLEGLLMDMSYINKIRGNALRVNAKMDMPKNILLMAEKLMRPVAEEMHRQLEFDVPTGLPMLTTDGELMSVALSKLIENGLRYSPEHDGKVTVRAAGEGNKAIITVEDNGVGMTPDEIAKLGTIFFRSDNDVVRQHKGSGLGIPIVYGIVKLLEGEISVESEAGKGTCFRLVFKGMV
ncbi:MAG: HAMP domain-containing sensor histidine kinase [bacterium]|nr:HAMP domain-containing sensor histidine kinase [bacterium]